ncbi:MAG TPA: helix-turn-helix transcriptional regulator, partial [Candidatus Limnocylindria bacterium]
MPARVNPDVPGEAKLLRAVGKRIRALREKNGLTMAELGQSTRGVVYFQRQYVWKMETGRVAPSLAALAHFAKRLDVTLAEEGLRGVQVRDGGGGGGLPGRPVVAAEVDREGGDATLGEERTDIPPARRIPARAMAEDHRASGRQRAVEVGL